MAESIDTKPILDIPVLTFHKIDPKFEWGVTRVTPHQFIRILKHLKAWGYESVTAEQAFLSPETLPEKPVILTFDDAYQSVYQYAFPAMQKLGFTGTLFIISHFVGKPNTWDVNLGGKIFQHIGWQELGEMQAAGFEMGSHTAFHPDLTRVSKDRVLRELEQSKALLEDKLARPIQTVSYPFGRYNSSILQASVDAGYKIACGFWVTRHARQFKELFVFPRKGYYLFDNTLNLRMKLHNGFVGGLETIKLRAINFFSHGTSLVKRPPKEVY